MAIADVLDTVMDRSLVLGYTRIGPEVRKNWWPADPRPGSMSDRRVLVTGDVRHRQGSRCGLGPAGCLRPTSWAVTRSTATRLGRDVRRCAARRRPGVPPGWVDTHGVKEYLTKFRALTLPFLRSPEQGADTLVWLAATKPHSEGTERFWHDRRLRPTRLRSQRDQGPDKPRRLWIISARPPESPWPLAPPTRADRARPQRNLMHPAVAANRTAGTTTRYRGRPSCR